MTDGVRHRFIHDFAARFRSDVCLLWPWAKNSAGYGHFAKEKKHYLVHRLVCRIVHGEPSSEELQALHSCGNGHLGCCNPRHLRWGTRSDNTQDRWQHGTFLHGERSAPAKLTDQQAREIKQATGPQREIAKTYGVSKATVSLIKTGKTWRYVH